MGHNGSTSGRATERRPWTFLTNHARVLVQIARRPHSRVRDIAAAIGITERSTQAIVSDLEAAGYITRTRVGRRTHYDVDPEHPFRHPAEADHLVRDLLAVFTDHDHPAPAGGRPAAESGDPAQSTNHEQVTQ
ncbi:helix-turn-helix domain-containing protein [Spirillospora sp. NPDC049652]